MAHVPFKDGKPTNAPTVTVETTDALGYGRVQKLQLDTNRYSVKLEALQTFANLVAIPAQGLFVDALSWVCSVGVLIRLPLSLTVSQLIPPLALWAALFVITVVLTFPLVMVFLQVEGHMVDCIYRLALTVAGAAIATQLFWIV